MTAVKTPGRLTGVRQADAPDRATEVAAWILSASLVVAVVGVALQTAVDLIDFWAFDRSVEILRADSDVTDRADSLVRWEPGRVFWPLVYLPLLAAFLLALRHVARKLPARQARFVLVGIALLVAAVGFELLSSAVVRAGFDRDSVVYALEVVPEEGADVAGWILIAGALLSAFVPGFREPAVTMPAEGG